ncbi:hypothetical protein XHC_0396 [Xanthomonas hortorum pv. carotae str. M081]|nr:hypothetical protein XHC_0396 [Xanthomonas hortorum pv. carotae str. M081]
MGVQIAHHTAAAVYEQAGRGGAGGKIGWAIQPQRHRAGSGVGMQIAYLRHLHAREAELRAERAHHRARTFDRQGVHGRLTGLLKLGKQAHDIRIKRHDRPSRRRGASLPDTYDQSPLNCINNFNGIA